jgi:hypothetical protein
MSTTSSSLRTRRSRATNSHEASGGLRSRGSIRTSQPEPPGGLTASTFQPPWYSRATTCERDMPGVEMHGVGGICRATRCTSNGSCGRCRTAAAARS